MPTPKIQRRRFDPDSAQSEAIDYLLRRLDALDTFGGDGGDAGDLAPFEGPIDDTYTVAASNSRPETRALADFVCDGLEDQVEIQAAIDAAAADTTRYGRVLLFAGRYKPSDGALITVPGDVTLAGVGAEVSVLECETGTDFTVRLTGDRARICDIGFNEAGGT